MALDGDTSAGQECDVSSSLLIYSPSRHALVWGARIYHGGRDIQGTTSTREWEVPKELSLGLHLLVRSAGSPGSRCSTLNSATLRRANPPPKRRRVTIPARRAHRTQRSGAHQPRKPSAPGSETRPDPASRRQLPQDPRNNHARQTRTFQEWECRGVWHDDRLTERGRQGEGYRDFGSLSRGLSCACSNVFGVEDGGVCRLERG